MGCQFSKNPLNASTRRRRRQQQQAHRRSLPHARRAAKSCLTCLRHNFPVITITVFLVYSFYAFAVELCLIPILHPEVSGTGTEGAEGISLLNFRWLLFTVFNLILIMFAWSYYAVVFSHHQTADPAKYNLHQEDLTAAQQTLPPPPPPETSWPPITPEDEEDWIYLASQLKAHSLGLYEREAQEDVNGLVYRQYRYCILCQALKPDRAHHCRKCQCCILRFDHHCPYTNNCVGFGNYKAYLLAIIYGFILSSFTTLVVVAQLIAWFVNGAASRSVEAEWRALAVWIVLLCIAIPSCGMIWLLLYLHCGLASLNRTNIEHQVSPEIADCQLGSPYKLESVRRNWKQIFTGWPPLWLLPIRVKSGGDGLTYLKRVGSIRASELNIFNWLNSDSDGNPVGGDTIVNAVAATAAPILLTTAASVVRPTSTTAVKLLSSRTVAVEISANNIARRSSEAALSAVGLPRRSTLSTSNNNNAVNVVGSRLKPRNSSVTTDSPEDMA